jgi:hypothetical protein
MSNFKDSVYNLIEEYCIKEFCCEDLKSDRNPDTVRTLGKMDGMLEYVCEQYDFQCNKYIPASIRAKLCINKTEKITKTGKKRKVGTKLDLAETICKLYPEWGLVIPYDEIVKVHVRGKNKGQQYIDDDCEFLNQTDAIGIGLYHFGYGDGKDSGK